MALTTIGTVALRLKNFVANLMDVGLTGILVERPDNSLSIAQANALGHTMVEVSNELTVDIDESTLATQATLAAILAKVIAAPATSALQTALNAFVAHGTWTPATAAAAADSAVISAAATTVRAVVASNSHATDTVYLQFFDSATVPADTAVPRVPSIPIAAKQTVMVDLGGLECANGLSWASSSTVDTKTITAITPLQVSAELVS